MLFGAVLQGFGWAIAKALAEAGAEISLGVWVGALPATLSHCVILFNTTTVSQYRTIPCLMCCLIKN